MVLKLPDLQGFPIVGPDGKPTPYFERLWSDMKSKLENEVGALQAAAAAQAAADAADAAAAAANTAAAAAQTAADDAATANTANARFLAISNSNVTGCTITATDAGSDVTISVSAHVRHYADGSQVNVNAGSVTALSYSSHYWLFYDQASLAGGAVTYQATTNGPDALTTAAGGAHPDRHLVGDVQTPAALGAPIPGDGAVPPTIGGNWL